MRMRRHGMTMSICVRTPLGSRGTCGITRRDAGSGS
ncbi:UNVERIFIED_CONTAM: hypothetical protein GTU68_000200 [Idotea baltica]|nr:hypothetical protein [Idotea baltica]